MLYPTSATATSRKHTNEGNADSAVEHQAPLLISTEQISPANQQHKSNDFVTRAVADCRISYLRLMTNAVLSSTRSCSQICFR